MDSINNLDLLSVAIAVAGISIMGAVVYYSNRRSATNQAFFSFSIMTVLWSVFNYLAYSSTSSYYILWFLRLAIFAAVWHAYSLFQLFYIFPKVETNFTRTYTHFLLPIVGAVSIFTLTPYVFNRIGSVSNTGRVVSVVNGPGIILFSSTVLSLIASGLYLFFKKTFNAKGVERLQYKYILFGTLITFTLIVPFNFILPAFFDNANFIPLGGVFVFPFVLFTAYAIIRLKLLDIKVVATEVLTFVLAVATALEMVSSQSLGVLMLRSVIFALILLFGVLLIRSVRKEVAQRMELQEKTNELEHANIRLQELDKQKTDFLSIAAHQLRTPLSIANGYIELLEDGAYGAVKPETKTILHNMDESNQRLVKLVDEFLDITRIEQGRVKFDFKPAHIDQVIKSVMEEMKDRAKENNIKIKVSVSELPAIVLDEDKIRHVVFNYVDNTIKYAVGSPVTISAIEENDGISVRVQDEGVGFEKVDEVSFFQKFYRGNNVQGTNVNGTGLGLYVCRKFIEAHNGRVWAKSAGLGKGSEFGFWLPFHQETHG